MERILIATDGSASAGQAVDFGLELAREQGAAVAFAHVILGFEVLPAHPIGESGARPRPPSAADYEPLARAAAAAKASGVSATTQLLVGDPAAELAAYAESIDADAIVVGRRGHGMLASAIVGSVSRGLLRDARRPVVVVPTTWRRRRPGRADAAEPMTAP